MIDQLRQIAVFAKVAEQGSFRGAAKALQLSPSVVSHHISQLEKQLDVALLYRSTRKLSLTSDGKTLLTSAQTMLQAAENFVNSASDSTQALNGHLNIALPAFMQNSKLVDYIGDFALLHPNVAAYLDFSDVRREIIQDGVDLAVRVGKLPSNNLKARKLHQYERSIVISKALLKKLPRSATPSDIENLTWVELSPVGLNVELRNKAGEVTVIRPKSQIKVNSVQSVLQLVKNSNGVGIIPEFMFQGQQADNSIVQILKNWQLKPIGVHLVWPQNAPKTGLVKQLVDHLTSKKY